MHEDRPGDEAKTGLGRPRQAWEQGLDRLGDEAKTDLGTRPPGNNTRTGLGTRLRQA